VSENAKHKIQELLNDVSQFNANDVLVDLDNNLVIPIELKPNNIQPTILPIDSSIKSILNTAKKTKKEQGIFPLCLTQGFIEWEVKQFVVRSPLFLFPCHVEISKVKDTVKIIPLEEDVFINPFVVNRLLKEFNLQLPEELTSLDSFCEFLRDNDFNQLDSTTCFFGNFHHHRFEIIKELEELLNQTISPSLAQLLGEEQIRDAHELSIGNELLFPTDLDQLEVFKSIKQDHTVVQGPPGTGKSQVLSNLLAKLLLKGSSAVVVSEKRVALEVLEKKMQVFDLGRFCFVATSETTTKDVLNELKSDWNSLEQAKLLRPQTNLLLSEQYRDQLQQQLDVLNRPHLIGGISYPEFQAFLKNRTIERIPFSSDLPSMEEWISARAVVERIYTQHLNETIGLCSIGCIQANSFLQMDSLVKKWIKEIQILQNHFDIKTWSDFQEAMKTAALCHNYSNPIVRKHAAILTANSKEQKRFIKLRKQFLQAQLHHATLELEKDNWKKLPNLIETNYLLELSDNSSLLGKWKFKKQWSKFSILPSEKAKDCLLHWKSFLANNEVISQIKIELCEIGVDELPLELELIQQQLHYTNEEEQQKWLDIPCEKRLILSEQNAPLNHLYTQFKSNFRWQDSTDILTFLNAFAAQFESLTLQHLDIKHLSEIVLRNLKNHLTFDDFELAVCKHNWVKFTAQFPSFSDFKAADLLNRVQLIIATREKESTLFAAEIQQQQWEKFQYYHTLLQTPPAKLGSAEKELRSRLKKGKAILVKEFSKTRNHPSLRELFASDAQDWIRLFKPIWLSNPAQIAKCFPMEEQLFDVGIFDEASQLPLQNALGTIQRSKRILVAGDHQQMGPSSYFKSGNGEVVDLLHQASYYWRNVALKHHYRSEHPALIQFSNKHFYNNELLAFPSVTQEKSPIIWHYLEQGRFIDRKNQLEAKEVAQLIEKEINGPNHIGIVAFSESQLHEISACLSPKTLQILEDRIENDTAFFKALENVQGEECDHLIISFAYAYSEEHEFHMRFGPMNSKNGSKRLNVLLTRARKKIDFFSSVKSSDFKLSSNESINLLRQFLHQIEHDSNLTQTDFPLGLRPTVMENRLIFEGIQENIQDAEELITLVGVLENRGWQLQFV
jgi:hypothetical protein